MFDFLQGRVEALELGQAVIATGGIGWTASVSSRCAEQLRLGEEVRLLVHLAVSENALALFGFVDPVERLVFRRLLSVSGVGPGMALGLLSALSPAELRQAVQRGDTARLTAVRGVGRKTAERLQVELRGALDTLPLHDAAVPSDGDGDLLQVLEGLGFRAPEARRALEAARADLGAEVATEDLLRFPLKHPRTPS